MPFALVLLGLALVIASAQDTYVALGRQVRSDLTGQGSFIYWAGAIGMAGAVGYVKPLRPVSIALMGLILLVLVLKHNDFFAKFSQGIKSGPTAPQKPATNEPAASATQKANDAFLANNKGFGLGGWITNLFGGSSSSAGTGTSSPADGTKAANDAFLGNNQGFDLGKYAPEVLSFLAF